MPENVGNLTWGGPDWRGLFVAELDVALPREDEGRAAARALHGWMIDPNSSHGS